MSQASEGLLSPFLKRLRLKKAVNYVTGSSVLDCGCASAGLAKMLPNGVKYVGIDTDEITIAENKKKLPLSEFYCQDIEKGDLPLKGKFNTVLMTAVLEHLKNPGKVLAKLEQHVARNGRLVITTPIPSVHKLLKNGSKLGLFSKTAVKEHERYFDKEKLFDLLHSANFEAEYYRKFMLGYNQLVIAMKSKDLSEKKGGNYYDKHTSRNPITKLLIRHYFKTLDLFLKEEKYNSVLDVGCGEGHVLAHLKRMCPGVTVEGVESSEETAEAARRNTETVKISQGSVYELGYKKKSFDAVMALELLEHLTSPINAIKEIKRVSKKHVILSVPNEPFFRIANLLRLAHVKNFGNTPGHLNHWTSREFNAFLEKHFRRVTIKTSTLWTLALCEI